MKMLLPFLILLALYCGFASAVPDQAANADEAGFNCIDDPRDLDGNGIVNSLDLLRVEVEYGSTYPANPCVEYKVFDDTNQPTGVAIANSLGEIITPRGGMFLYPSEHPAYDSIRNGTPPPPPRACAP